MIEVDSIARRWVGPFDDWFAKHVEGHDGQVVHAGVDHYGALEWLAHWDIRGLERYLMVAVLPDDDSFRGRVEFWAEAGTATHYTRRLVRSVIASPDRMELCTEDIEEAINVMLQIEEKNLTEAVPLPLWRTHRT
ncbi:hypothetical protein ABT255_07790 [Streptomyces mirabilis]|uniref:hypothetical protein n=1 Tax=Streptomyces mirabilis TaxID=68239 RepID=UPI003318130B